MVFSFFVIFSALVVVNGYDEVLLGQSVLYGISYLAPENNSSLCYRQLSMIYEGLDVHRPWALKVLDCSGTPGSGFFWGNNLWLGNYAQCSDISNSRPLEVNQEHIQHPKPTPYDYPPFDMGFHVAYIIHNSTMQEHTQLPLEWTIQIGLCTPLSCTSEDLAPLIQEYIDNKYLVTQNIYNLDLNLTMVRFVHTDKSWLLSHPKTILLLTISGIFTILAITGTWFDAKNAKEICTENNNVSLVEKQKTNASNSSSKTTQIGLLGEIFKCFSISTNVRNFVKTDLPPDSISVIHGLKFFGMLWVIMVHAIFFQADYLVNVPYVYRLSENFFAQVFSNATYSVDTFFFLSGFLMAYLFFKAKKNAEKRDNLMTKIAKFWIMFVNRYLRLTPTYAMLILFTEVMLMYYRKNSVLYASEALDEICPKYWWRNLLYINNLFPRTEMCLNWSWYLAADTQFFAVGALLLLISTSFFYIAAILTLVLILTNVLSVTFISYSIKYVPTLDEQLRALDHIYDLPWCRIGPYLVGVITAYIFVVKLNTKLELKKRTRILFWCIFPLPNLWILFTLYTRQLSAEFSAVYMGISRTMWGVGIGWLVIACSTGNAKILEKFLSYPGWIPLSRLTYSAYLLNPLVAIMLYMGSNNPVSVSQASLGTVTLGVILTTYLFSFILTILVEYPTVLLSKLMFKKLLKQS